MFVGDEVLLGLTYPAARVRLADLVHNGLLRDASDDAYGQEIVNMVAAGPLGAVPVVSRLVEVHFAELQEQPDRAGLAMRWQAIGPDGALIPVLDADIWLTPTGDHAVRLTIAGAYRPPLGTLGAGIDRVLLQKVASATVRSFVRRLADAILSPPGPAGPRASGRGLPREPETT